MVLKNRTVEAIQMPTFRELLNKLRPIHRAAGGRSQFLTSLWGAAPPLCRLVGEGPVMCASVCARTLLTEDTQRSSPSLSSLKEAETLGLQVEKDSLSIYPQCLLSSEASAHVFHKY